MSETATGNAATPTRFAPGTPNWVDLATTDVAAANTFYTGLFGWEVQDLGPEAGGYVMYLLDGAVATAAGKVQGDGDRPYWSVYFATEDADATAVKVREAGGHVLVEPFDVMGQGRMAVFADCTGAAFAVWQAGLMPGLGKLNEPRSFGWCELNTRGLDRAAEFYASVFGWSAHRTEASETAGAVPYTEWKMGGSSFGGAMDMADSSIPAEVPPHWLVYFMAEDVETTAGKVSALGGSIMLEPQEYPGGKFAIVADPQGAAFGLMTPGK